MADLTQSAKTLIARFLRRKEQRPADPRPALADVLTESAPPLSIRRAARERGETWRMQRLLTFAISTNIILAGILLATAQLANSRPQMMIETKGDLREQIRVHFAVTELRKDNILFFLQTVLTLRNGITENGSPFLGTLQGLVAADLYRTAADDVQRNIVGVRAQGMTRSLVIEEVSGIDLEEEDGRQTGRLSAVVKGTMPIQAIRTKNGHPLAIPHPYRALVVLDSLPVSNLNPFGYYLVSLEEATGDKAVQAFDLKMAAQHAQARGK